MPGAHIQFQFWYAPFVPLLLEMVGLPSLLTFWLYACNYPVINDMDGFPVDPEDQHHLLLALVFWLTTFGPRPDGLSLNRSEEVVEKKKGVK